MYQIIKRDGKIVDFDITKIASAIKKAFEATDTEYTDDIIDFIALKVSADFLPKIKDGYVAVEDIQDSVEAVLDRLPTARILEQGEKGYLISAEVFGRGVEMWLRSQGDWVERVE